MCLISSSNKKGVSSHQLSRDLNITQKTAWFILHKVHALFAQDDSVALEGEASWMKCISAAWRPTSTSPRKPQILMVAPSRPRLPYSAWLPAGALPMPSWQKMSNRRHLSHTFQQFCADNAHLFTDELISYSGPGKMEYAHDVIEHGNKQFPNENGVKSNSNEVADITRICQASFRTISINSAESCESRLHETASVFLLCASPQMSSSGNRRLFFPYFGYFHAENRSESVFQKEFQEAAFLAMRPPRIQKRSDY